MERRSPSVTRWPAFGHTASPTVELSSELSVAALSPPPRSPLAIVPPASPNLGEHVPTAVDQKPNLKRYRSSGSLPMLARPPPILVGARSPRSSPLPVRQCRAGASPIGMGALEPLRSEAGTSQPRFGGAPRPPPIAVGSPLRSDSPPSNSPSRPSPPPPPPSTRPGTARWTTGAGSGTRPPPISLSVMGAHDLADEMPTPGTVPASAVPSAAASSPGFARPPVPAMSLVAPRLYVGDEKAAASLHTLREAHVTHVLNCTHLPNAHDDDVPGLTFLCLGLRDSAADAPVLQTAFARGVEFIADALAGGGTVLVHCRAGISRSPTLAAAYLVRATRTPVDEVFAAMRATRRVVDPNLTNWMALHEWERRELSADTRRDGASTPRTLAQLPRVRPLSRVG
jgi:protein-tyrosine phosphatase